MSIYYRVYSDASDSSVTVSNATYSVARASTAATISTATAAHIGQHFQLATYSCSQQFLQFDTSAVPAGGSGSLSLRRTSAPSAPSGDLIEVSIATSAANKIAGASIPAPLGSVVMPDGLTNRFAITLSGAVPVGAATTYLLASRNERLGTVPTGDERCQTALSEQTGTVDDPYLQVLAGTAWDFVAAGTSVEATGTSHILTEPAGVAAGDLLVACIASRIASTTQITLPSGWTRIGQALNNNILATTSALASGMMAYIIRGASAPALTFTHPAAPAPALGRIVAYRNVHQTAPLDRGVTQVTTATNTLAVSVAGLNTTLDDDLIVALTAGGQEATWSAFGATDPATNSGTTAASVLDPIWGQWLERAEQVTTTGNDTSLAVFDAVKQTAGPTGNLVATASLGAGHVVVAGSFKLALPPAVNFGDLVQTSSGTSTTATTAPTLPAPTTAGNLLVLTFAADDYNATVSSGWTESAEMEQQTFHGGYIWWLAATAGMTIPSYTIGSAVRSTWTLAEYKGPVAAGSADVSEGQLDATSSNTYTTPSATPSSGNRLLVAGLNAQHATIDLESWGSFTNSFTPSVASLFNGGNPRLSITQLRRVVAANGSTAYSTGGSHGVQVSQSRTGLIISFKEAPSGTTYNETVAETATAAETIALVTESLVRETETADWRETESGAIRITEGDFFVAPPIEANVAESASASDTVTKAVTSTSAQAENAGANETIGITLLRIGALAESAAAADTSTGLLTRIGAVAETASAVETTDASIVPAAGIFDVLVVETVPVVDTTDALVVGTKAIVETAAAVETIGKALSLTAAVAETTTAADTVGGLRVGVSAIAETAAAVETINGLLIGPAAVVESAAAVETITYSLTGAAGTTYNEVQAEVAAAVDSLTGRLSALGAIAEAASAFETTTRSVSYTKAIVEAAAAAETIGKTVSYTHAVTETAAAVETTTASLLGISAAIAETAAAAETIGATVVALPQIYDVTVVESVNAADTLTADIRRWEREPPPPWANWVEEATATAGWTRTAHASASWTREDAETGDWLLENRPVNRWIKE